MHRLADRQAWRHAGTAEYASASSWLRGHGGGLALEAKGDRSLRLIVREQNADEE